MNLKQSAMIRVSLLQFETLWNTAFCSSLDAIKAKTFLTSGFLGAIVEFDSSARVGLKQGSKSEMEPDNQNEFPINCDCQPTRCTVSWIVFASNVAICLYLCNHVCDQRDLLQKCETVECRSQCIL